MDEVDFFQQHFLKRVTIALIFFLTTAGAYSQQRIDRKALVQRHTIILHMPLN